LYPVYYQEMTSGSGWEEIHLIVTPGIE